MRPRTIALGLALVVVLLGIASRDGDREPAYEIRMQGDLRGKRGGSSNDTRITNPSTRTRRLTITWQLPSCKATNVSIQIINHHGRPIYDGDAQCEPFVIPIPAEQHVNVHLYGTGTYDLILSLE